ncbi:LysR family transcriptional regulator [uncultured Veillonella sp.]|uniref:LysR family transcriptional regulator n=1 Tax=uncultured Veillonella sp. TaxID=159268 RepID=UPI0026262538|nr:LysR family transcriptional regulator [uncultured Veillonella sp.]
MELQNLKYFLTIASEGSFNKAATVLYMSQPSLSKAIANLEKELNVELFKRNRRGVELTESGKKLYEYAKIVIAQLELIEGLSEQDVSSTTLTIASYPMPVISTVVAKLYEIQ